MADAFKDLLSGWPLLAAVLSLSALGGAAGALFGSYLKKRGETLAIKHDFAMLSEQPAANTRLTENIKAEVAGGGIVMASEFAYRKQQLEEFYGPIYAHLKLGAGLYDIWRRGRLDSVNQDIIGIFRTHNQDIAEIITRKAHLIEGDSMPSELQHFMTSAALFNVFTQQPGAAAGPPTDQLPEAKWPEDFENYILRTTEKLKRELDRLHRQFSVLADKKN